MAIGYILKNTNHSHPQAAKADLPYGVTPSSYGGASPSKMRQSGEKDIKFISELKGQFFSNLLLSLSLTVCLFSMAGT